jgi:transposase
MPPTLRTLKRRGLTSSDALVGNEIPNVSATKIENKGVKPKSEAQHSVKTAKKKKSNKRIKYQKASFNLRAQLVQMVDQEGYSIRQAAKKLPLKYSTAKCIYKLFVEESRLGTTHVSKDSVLVANTEEDGEPMHESKEMEASLKHERLTARIKKVKKEIDAPISVKNSMEQGHILLKQEYDACMESQYKGSSILASDHYRKNSLQSDTTRSDSTGTTSPVNQPQKGGNAFGANKPSMIAYIPQIHQNCIVLIPVSMPGSMENGLPSFDLKSSLFAPIQQSQAIGYTSHNPSGYLLNNNNSNANLSMLGLNLLNQLRTIGVRMP